jgi:hypothetical protein
VPTSNHVISGLESAILPGLHGLSPWSGSQYQLPTQVDEFEGDGGMLDGDVR